MIFFRPQCYSCEYFHKISKINDWTPTCEAFQAGIPLEIISNEFDHSQPYEGDDGIQYKRKSV